MSIASDDKNSHQDSSQISDSLGHDSFLHIAFLFWAYSLDFKKLWVAVRNAGGEHSLSLVVCAHWDAQLLGMFNFDTVHSLCY